MLGKTRDRYQAYCTTYKMHTMVILHGGAGCPVDRDINLHIEYTEGVNTGQRTIMRVTVVWTLPLPLEDQRQMATPANLYPATKPS